jgi:hypothetical protein
MSSTTGVLIITSVLGFGLIGESKRCTSIETFYYMFLFVLLLPGAMHHGNHVAHV